MSSCQEKGRHTKAPTEGLLFVTDMNPAGTAGARVGPSAQSSHPVPPAPQAAAIPCRAGTEPLRPLLAPTLPRRKQHPLQIQPDWFLAFWERWQGVWGPGQPESWGPLPSGLQSASWGHVAAAQASEQLPLRPVARFTPDLTRGCGPPVPLTSRS